MLVPHPDMSLYKDAKVQFLFVYGTLKAASGHMRASVLKDNCTFIGEDHLKGYLIHLGAFPAFVPEPKGMVVKGEVWRLPEKQEDYDKLMRILDGIEGIPTLYWRLPFRTFKGYVAWAYFQNKEKLHNHSEVIPSGKWEGVETPKRGWTAWMNENPQFRWPTKPLVRMDTVTNCRIVEQFYPETGAVPVAVVGENPPPAAKALPPPEPKKEPPLFELCWLDPKGSKLERANEKDIEG